MERRVGYRVKLLQISHSENVTRGEASRKKALEQKPLGSGAEASGLCRRKQRAITPRTFATAQPLTAAPTHRRLILLLHSLRRLHRGCVPRWRDVSCTRARTRIGAAGRRAPSQEGPASLSQRRRSACSTGPAGKDLVRDAATGRRSRRTRQGAIRSRGGGGAWGVGVGREAWAVGRRVKAEERWVRSEAGGAVHSVGGTFQSEAVAVFATAPFSRPKARK